MCICLSRGGRRTGRDFSSSENIVFSFLFFSVVISLGVAIGSPTPPQHMNQLFCSSYLFLSSVRSFFLLSSSAATASTETTTSMMMHAGSVKANDSTEQNESNGNGWMNCFGVFFFSVFFGCFDDSYFHILDLGTHRQTYK